MKLKEQKKFGILWLSVGAALFLAGLLLGETGYSSYISGFGGALMGVVSAVLKFVGVDWFLSGWASSNAAEWTGLAMYLVLIGYFAWHTLRAKKEE